MSRGGKIGKRFTKATLPTKTCVTCGKPFAWRKVWARDWERVIYCSDRCRDGQRSPPKPRRQSGT